MPGSLLSSPDGRLFVMFYDDHGRPLTGGGGCGGAAGDER